MPARWPKEKEEYVEAVWGTVPIPKIAEKLGKTVNAVKLKAYKLGLGRHIHSGEHITLNQLCRALNVSYSYTVIKSANNGMPIKRKKSINKQYKVIYVKDFWEWAERNKMKVDFSKVERFALGTEPPWVEYKREADIKANKFKKTPWTQKEDERLKEMLNSARYGYRETSILLQRTEAAIIRRMNDLKLTQRPIKACKHNPWTPAEEEMLVEMYYKGYIAEVISEEIPKRSAKAIQGKIERMVKEGQLEKSRYKEGLKFRHRLIDNTAISKKKKQFVDSRPEKERVTMRRFCTHLLKAIEVSKTSPDEESITKFINTWRDLNAGEGILREN